MTQAVAFVETLCDEMTPSQIAKALDRWERICEHHGWSDAIEFESRPQDESQSHSEESGVDSALANF
jgi:hypothetical protein